MRWAGWVLVGVAATCVGVPTYFCGVPMAVHDMERVQLRWSVERSSAAIGVPLETRDEFGILWGASNHCDTQVWVLVAAERPWTGQAPGWLYDVTDPEHLVLVREDGERVNVGEDCADCYEGGIARTDLATLTELAHQPRTGAGRHAYVVQAGGQSYDRWDLRDVRCH